MPNGGEFFVIQHKNWHFCKTVHGITYCDLIERKQGPYNALIADGQQDFDIAVDEFERIHMFCQNRDGDIIYMRQEDSDWSKRTLLKSKSKAAYDKQFRLLWSNSLLHGFYAISHKDKFMLAYCVVGENDEAPQVLDYIDGAFCAEKDDDDNIYVVYCEKTQGVVGFRKLKRGAREFGSFIPIEDMRQPTEAYLFVNEGAIHIIGNENGVITHYIIQESRNVDLMNKAAVAHKIAHDNGGKQPILLKEGRAMWALWESAASGRVIATKTEDGGYNWSRKSEFIAPKFAGNKCYNIRHSKDAISSSAAYGFISQGEASLYIINHIFSKEVMLSPREIIRSEATEKENAAPVAAREDKLNALEFNFVNMKLTQALSAIEKLEGRVKELEKARTANS